MHPVTLIFASGKSTLSNSPWTQKICHCLSDRFSVRTLDLVRPFEDFHLIQQYQKVLHSAPPSRSIIIGGKSQGGRIATLLADKYEVLGCFCLGYPFYTPTINDGRRVTPLRSINTPTLIIQGANDQYGKKSIVEKYTLSDQVKIHWIKDAGHDLTSCEKIIADTISSFFFQSANAF